MTPFVIAILGLEFGSFANVCIYRWPRNMSVAWPMRSFCPWCRHKLHWHENIPVLSYIWLGGRCRHCRSPISPRYPLVEILLSIFWITGWVLLRQTGHADAIPFLVSVFTFLFVLLVTTVTDLDWKIIPDEATLILFLVSLSTSAWNPFLNSEGAFSAVEHSLVGAVVGVLILWFISVIGRMIFGKEAMGGGDIKLLGGIGSFFGWEAAIISLFIASVLGCVVVLIGLATGKFKRGHYIPFGPFLNAGAFLEFIFLCTSTRLFSFMEMNR